MIGLSKITDKIIAEARNDARLAVEEANRRAEEIGAEYAARAGELKREVDADARRRAEEIVSRAHADEEMIKRSARLSARGAMVDEAFATARKEILNLSEEKYLELLSALLYKAYRQQTEDARLSRELYGEEDAPEASVCEILLSERDRDRLGKKLLSLAEAKWKEEGLSELPVLSDDTAPIAGGLILRFGSIEINCSVDALFGSLRSEWEGRVVARLFPEKKG